MNPGAVPGERENREGILEATRRQVERGGWGAVSLGRVAAQAGVSKALIHYHFRDKQQLLCAVAVECTRRIEDRGMAVTGAPPSGDPLAAFWNWLQEELKQGDVSALLQLARAEDIQVQERATTGLAECRTLVRALVAQVLGALEARPGIPVPLLADVMATLVEGLAAQHNPRRKHEEQSVVDVLWLSLMALAE
ncbi:MAG: TetR/AcrR family transcriptional regulator [Gemmatimonadaceae bacterium]